MDQDTPPKQTETSDAGITGACPDTVATLDPGFTAETLLEQAGVIQ